MCAFWDVDYRPSTSTCLEDCLAFVDEQQREVQQRQLQPEASPGDDEAQRVLVLQEVETRSRFLGEEDEALRAQLHAWRTNQQIGNVDTWDDSFALVGLPDSVVGKVNQRIGDVATKSRSRAVVGVYKGDFDFGKLEG